MFFRKKKPNCKHRFVKVRMTFNSSGEPIAESVCATCHEKLNDLQITKSSDGKYFVSGELILTN